MKILYTYEHDASDLHIQSGRPAYLRNTLLARGHNVIDLFPLFERPTLGEMMLSGVVAGFGKRYRPERRPVRLARMAQRISDAVRDHQPDLVFGPSSIPFSKLRTGKKRIFCADATFAALSSIYPGMRNVSSRYRAEANGQEAGAIQNAHACLYPSDWAARSAISHYGGDPSKVHVIPFGANVSSPPDRATVLRSIGERKLAEPTFLFIGNDWERKGGDVALWIVSELNARGIPARMNVISTHKPNRSKEFVRFWGRVDKSDRQGEKDFDRLLLGSDFFILPTSAEAFGLSICEAMCYGLPAVVMPVGGIPTIVKNGHNGVYIDPEDPLSVVVEIMRLLQNRDAYCSLAWSARLDYERQFNWDNFVSRLEDIASG